MTSIDFHYGALAGKLAPEIGNLEKLQFLFLSNNVFEGVIPPQIGYLSELTFLRLDENKFTGTFLSQIIFLSELVTLDLSRNSLTGTIPTQIGLLNFLKNLAFSENQFTGGIPSQFGQMPALSSIVFHMNLLTGSIPLEIYLNTHITDIMGSDNFLTGTIPTEIALLTGLGFFTMNANQLTGTIPSELALLPMLSFSSLSNNKFSWVSEELCGIDIDLKCNPYVGDTTISCVTEKEIEFHTRHTVYSQSQCKFLDCPYPERCKDAASCTDPEKYVGRGCARCGVGYFSAGQECYKCTSPGIQIFLLFLFCVLTLIGLYLLFRYSLSNDSKNSGSKSYEDLVLSVNLVLRFGQVISLALLYGLKWPPQVTGLISFSKTSSSMFSIEGTAPECWSNNNSPMNFFSKWALTLFFPFLALAVFVVFAMVQVQYTQSLRIQAIKSVSLLMVLFFFLSFVSTLFNGIACSGSNYLKADPSVECGEATHMFLIIIALPLIILSIYFICFLYLKIQTIQVHAKHGKLEDCLKACLCCFNPLKNSNTNNTTTASNNSHWMLRFVSQVYSDECSYWETVVLVRGFLLALPIVIPSDTAGAVFIFFLLIIYSLLTFIKQPYKVKKFNRIEVGAHLICAAVFAFGMIASNGIFFFCILYFIFL